MRNAGNDFTRAADCTRLNTNFIGTISLNNRNLATFNLDDIATAFGINHKSIIFGQVNLSNHFAVEFDLSDFFITFRIEYQRR